MRDVLLCDGLRADSSLNCDCEQMRRNRLFDLDADVFGVFKGFLLVYEESQSVDWIVHDVDDHLHNI